MKGIVLLICFLFTTLFISNANAQGVKYNQLEQKPIGNNIAETTVWRYKLKKIKKKRDIDYTQVEADTLFNEDKTIKSITQKGYSINYYFTNEYEYPDTIMEEKNIYNTKGLLVYKEEPYHIHVDYPCMQKQYHQYDERNRIIMQEVYECDTMFYRKMTTVYNDVTKQIRDGVLGDKGGKEEYHMLRKYDAKNRIIESGYYSNNDTSMDFGCKVRYLKHGKIAEQKFSDEKDYAHYIYYNKQHLKIKDVKTLSFEQSDTFMVEGEYFTYDKRGNLLLEKSIHKYPDSLYETNIYKYDENNNKIYHERINKGYKVNTIEKYFYRNDGLLDYFDTFYIDGEIVRYKYEYKFR